MQLSHQAHLFFPWRNSSWSPFSSCSNMAHAANNSAFILGHLLTAQKKRCGLLWEYKYSFFKPEISDPILSSVSPPLFLMFPPNLHLQIL